MGAARGYVLGYESIVQGHFVEQGTAGFGCVDVVCRM
jgi:hypothetical protein